VAAADAAATAAEAGAEATKAMKAAAGRSSYVPTEVRLLLLVAHVTCGRTLWMLCLAACKEGGPRYR